MDFAGGVWGSVVFPFVSCFKKMVFQINLVLCVLVWLLSPLSIKSSACALGFGFVHCSTQTTYCLGSNESCYLVDLCSQLKRPKIMSRGV